MLKCNVQTPNRPWYVLRSLHRQNLANLKPQTKTTSGPSGFVSLVTLTFNGTVNSKSDKRKLRAANNKENKGQSAIRKGSSSSTIAHKPRPLDDYSKIKRSLTEKIQTDFTFEEIVDREIKPEKCCQADLFFERPKFPKFVPAIETKDVATEICDGDLYDFRTEMTPIIIDFISQLISEAEIYAKHRTEMFRLKELQEKLEKVRENELLKLRKLEEREKRIAAEKEARKRQFNEANEIVERNQIDLKSAVWQQNANLMHFKPNLVEDKIEKDNRDSEIVNESVNEYFLPSLLDNVREEVKNAVFARDFVSQMVLDVVRKQIDRSTD